MARIVLNQRGIDATLQEPGVIAELRRRMERVAADAKANAPVATGAYRDSIHVEEVSEGGVTQVRVVADVRHAMFVEADTGNLARSLDAAGGE